MQDYQLTELLGGHVCAKTVVHVAEVVERAPLLGRDLREVVPVVIYVDVDLTVSQAGPPLAWYGSGLRKRPMVRP